MYGRLLGILIHNEQSALVLGSIFIPSYRHDYMSITVTDD